MIRMRSALSALALLVLAAPPAVAHHGGTGDYEASRPLYIAGEVVEARYTAPHGIITVRVPSDLQVPQELPGTEELRGYEHWDGHPQVEGTGEEREILLPPDITSQVGALPDPPGPGDEISLVAYRRCDEEDNTYTGELRVQMLYAAEQRFPAGFRITRIVDECEHHDEEEGAADGEDQGQDNGARTTAADDSGIGDTATLIGGVVAVFALGVLAVRYGTTRLRRRTNDGNGR